MAKAGVGGVFLKSKSDPAVLAAWYQTHLGMPLENLAANDSPVEEILVERLLSFAYLFIKLAPGANSRSIVGNERGQKVGTRVGLAELLDNCSKSRCSAD